MDELGHIEFHLMLDELELLDEPTAVKLELTKSEVGLITAALGLLRQLADFDIISLSLDESGELGSPREATRMLALEAKYNHFYSIYTNIVLGCPLKA